MVLQHFILLLSLSLLYPFSLHLSSFFFFSLYHSSFPYSFNLYSHFPSSSPSPPPSSLISSFSLFISSTLLYCTLLYSTLLYSTLLIRSPLHRRHLDATHQFHREVSASRSPTYSLTKSLPIKSNVMILWHFYLFCLNCPQLLAEFMMAHSDAIWQEIRTVVR